MRRTLFAIFLVAACAGGRSSEPAWPKPQASETDGGESLAPRQASSVAAIDDADDDAKSSGADAEPAAEKPDAKDKPDKPADKPAEPAAPKEPEVIMTEDIVIEIED